MMGRQTINEHQTDKTVTAHCVSATVESIRVLEQRPWEGEGSELGILGFVCRKQNT